MDGQEKQPCAWKILLRYINNLILAMLFNSNLARYLSSCSSSASAKFKYLLFLVCQCLAEHQWINHNSWRAMRNFTSGRNGRQYKCLPRKFCCLVMKFNGRVVKVLKFRQWLTVKNDEIKLDHYVYWFLVSS